MEPRKFIVRMLIAMLLILVIAVILWIMMAVEPEGEPDLPSPPEVSVLPHGNGAIK